MNRFYQEKAFDEQANGSHLTIEKLRKYKEFENASDEQALDIIQSITTLCQIACRVAMESKIVTVED